MPTLRVKTIFRDIISKDVVMRYKIRNIKAIEELAKYPVSNFSAEITFSKLRKVIGLKKVETVKNYVGYLQILTLYSTWSVFHSN